MERRPLSRNTRLCIPLAFLSISLMVLACAPLTALPVTSGPRWACPSVTPLPTRVKESVPQPTTTPGVDPGTDDTYYETWEQEYGLPLMTPTIYARTGTSHLLGQRVELWPVHVLVAARSGGVVGAQQLQIVSITWLNHHTGPLPMDYSSRVKIRAIRQPSGALLVSDTWGMSAGALAAAQLAAPTDEIPVGESTVEVPILTPPGAVETVDLAFLAIGAPGSAAPAPTPTATTSSELQTGSLPFITVQWSAGQPMPPCDSPGVTTEWGDGRPPAGGVVAPSGTARVVQIALNQVGKPYVWGAKGPNQFDCSGLTQWAYAQIGVTIPVGTSGQWPRLPSVDPAHARPGDLIFFDTLGRGQITHVGMLAGDLNGDGAWDMVHAASPAYGVRVDYSVFERPYYASKYRGLRTVRR